MRRVARYLTLVGPLLVVLALSKIHARYEADPPYDYTGSFRFAWSLAYAMLLSLSAYGFGLPDIPRRRREVATALVGSSVVAALAISSVHWWWAINFCRSSSCWAQRSSRLACSGWLGSSRPKGDATRNVTASSWWLTAAMPKTWSLI